MKLNLSKKFTKFVDFLNFTHEFRNVIRIARIPNDTRMENDAEHVCQLALAAWFLIDQDKLKLNKELCFMYALAHDLVEVYSGDTFFLDKEKSLTKHKREMEALKKIQKRFPNFKSLIKTIKNYEKREDDESKFIYALDKVIPPIQVCLEDGKLWHEQKSYFDEVLQNKNPKIKTSKHIDKYWQELLPVLIKNKRKLFPSN